jgi:segregation and condensation protein B
VKKPLLTRGPLKTLAYIAYKQPVSQKRVADMRGSHAYSHMRELKERNLVRGKKKGRSTTLTTTEYFADYFNLSHNLSAMKRQLKNVFEQELETDVK